MSRYKLKGGNKNKNEELFEEYLDAKNEHRKKFWKRLGIIIVCLALVFAFCLPAIGTLLK